MARMIDEILNDGYHYRNGKGGWSKKFLTGETKRFVSDVPITFCIDNVTEYLYKGTNKERFLWAKDFPNCVPPYPFFWMETHIPDQIISEEYGTVSTEKYPNRVGCAFHAIHVPAWIQRLVAGDPLNPTEQQLLSLLFDYYEDDIRKSLKPNDVLGSNLESPLAEVMVLYTLYNYKGERRKNPIITAKDLEAFECHWLLSASLFIENKPGKPGPKIIGQLTTAMFPMDRESNIKWIPKIAAIDLGGKTDIREGGTDFFPFMMALSFMNCINVNVEDRTVPEKVARKFEKKHGRKPVEYKVLDIVPLRQVTARTGDGTPTGIKSRMHLVRGHIKRYTAEKPLFGRHVGTWFWASQVRGSKDEGIIEKDYQMKEVTA